MSDFYVSRDEQIRIECMRTAASISNSGDLTFEKMLPWLETYVITGVWEGPKRRTL